MIDAERIGELRAYIDMATPPHWHSTALHQDLLAILDAYPALAEENERLKADNEALWTMENGVAQSASTRAEKAEAELERLRTENDRMMRELANLMAEEYWVTRAQKAEADLDDALGAVRERTKRAEQAEAALLAAQAVNAKNGGIIAEQMAALERVKPLVQAVMAWDGRVEWQSVKPLILAIDAYREKESRDE